MAGFDLSTYITVQERIAKFWERYPDGRILTRLESVPDDFDRCRYRAEVYRNADDERPAAVGHAVGNASDRGPAGQNPEETCETSAIGRALANMGFSKSQQDRPSREEMTIAAARAERMARPAAS